MSSLRAQTQRIHALPYEIRISLSNTQKRMKFYKKHGSCLQHIADIEVGGYDCLTGDRDRILPQRIERFPTLLGDRAEARYSTVAHLLVGMKRG